MNGFDGKQKEKETYMIIKYYLEWALHLLLKFGCGGDDEKENKIISKQVMQ